MLKSTEELKMVLDLAASNGRKEAQNEMLEAQKQQLEEANTRLSSMLEQKDRLLVEKDRIIEDLKQRISDMEALLADNTCADEGQKQVVYVSQYILLDGPKTVNYVCALDNEQKMFAGHLLLHTMADNTPKQVYDKVNKITQLASDPTERLIDTMEKMAERPTYNYESGATHDDKRSQLLLGEGKEKLYD